MSAHPNIPVADIAYAFDTMHWPELNKAHLTAADMQPVLDNLATRESLTVTDVGVSFEGRPVKRFTLGSGKLVILAWTQMHGDEPTATAAVLDWLRILTAIINPGAENNPVLSGLPAAWSEQITLHVIPMLNPDGAERCTRVNGQGIDINRDAKALQSPEGRILYQQVADLAPDIAFNLHDQNPYYTCGSSSNPATIAFLAPAYHKDKHVDASRLRAKQLIAVMAETLGHFIPGCIARYDDTYSFRSFGDNIAASGASTILIESGAAKQDPNRQIARKMNVIGLQSALEALLNNQVNRYSLADYYRIPENREDGLCDVKFHNLTLGDGDTHHYRADISILTDRKTGVAQIGAIGDLRTLYGFTDINGDGLTVLPAKSFDVTTELNLDDASYRKLLAKGYSCFIDSEQLLTIDTNLPVRLESDALPVAPMIPGTAAFFLVAHLHSRSPVGALLNGQWITL